MRIIFEKYHGCGNDFIIIDNTKGQIDETVLTVGLVSNLCSRRYGVGADGLMILQASSQADFKMYYANSDGNESTMCGNGGRCIVAFAYKHSLIQNTCQFEAIDGLHYAKVLESGDIELGMSPIIGIEEDGDGYILDSGSPHYVTVVNQVADYPVLSKGRAIRKSDNFVDEGINVNFVEIKNGSYRIRTYERGVEQETEACGTGVTAAAIVLSHYYDAGKQVALMTNGGLLSVNIGLQSDNRWSQITLTGPAVYVYSGTIEL